MSFLDWLSRWLRFEVTSEETPPNPPPQPKKQRIKIEQQQWVARPPERPDWDETTFPRGHFYGGSAPPVPGGQWHRIEKTLDAFPYLILTHGPTLSKCSDHRNAHGLVLPVGHAYWRTHPLRQSPGCKCRVRQVGHREYERLLRDGIQDPDAPPVLKNGRPTGHRQKRTIPIRTEPPKE